jgi:hemolysin activation/secretion protein
VVYFNGLMGSSHPHFKWILDLRNYQEFGRGHLAYFQFYAKFLGGSKIPFRNMALLGGDKLLRGYFRGRYRDHNMYVIQAEYHSPPLWRLSLVVFAGLGDVYRLPADLRLRESKPSGGIGLRYRVFRDRRLNLRFDAALGRNDGGIYLGIGEAF